MLKKIYKYRPLNQYSINEIVYSYFVYSCPIDFNDPLEIKQCKERHRIPEFFKLNRQIGTYEYKVDKII